MYEIGRSTCLSVPGKDDFEQYAKAGLNALELCPYPTQIPSIDFKKLRRFSNESGVKIWSMHLPYYGTKEVGEIDPSSLDAEIRKNTWKYFLEMIERATEGGIDKFVVHSSREPIPSDERGERLKCAQETLNELAERTATLNATIAVEDLPRTCLGNCSDEIQFITSVNPKLKVCFDTNHLLFEDNVDFINKIGNKIVTLHVSDYNFKDERHWLPGEGESDWQAIYTALKNVGYNGVWMYEVDLKTPGTITRPRDLVLSDFVTNAKEIFENKPLTIIK